MSAPPATAATEMQPEAGAAAPAAALDLLPSIPCGSAAELPPPAASDGAPPGAPALVTETPADHRASEPQHTPQPAAPPASAEPGLAALTAPVSSAATPSAPSGAPAVAPSHGPTAEADSTAGSSAAGPATTILPPPLLPQFPQFEQAASHGEVPPRQLVSLLPSGSDGAAEMQHFRNPVSASANAFAGGQAPYFGAAAAVGAAAAAAPVSALPGNVAAAAASSSVLGRLYASGERSGLPPTTGGYSGLTPTSAMQERSQLKPPSAQFIPARAAASWDEVISVGDSDDDVDDAGPASRNEPVVIGDDDDDQPEVR